LRPWSTREKPEPAEEKAPDDDLGLLTRFLAGERAAFDELMRRHERPIYSLAMRYLRDHDEASDILQRTFLKAFEKASGFERRSLLRTWLYRIAVNLCKNRLRDLGRWQKVDPEEEASLQAPATAEGSIEDGERQSILLEAVEKLPPRQRQILELRVFGDLSFREIARVLECTENAAKVNYHYAVKNLMKAKGQAS
jgi:RNA polymerase sigma-70 factor (ECF subfamily)